MGIPGVNTDEWRTLHQIPDSDIVYQIEDEMIRSEAEEEDGGLLLDDHDNHEQRPGVMASEIESQKRGLSTVSTQSRQGSPTKKVQLQVG